VSCIRFLFLAIEKTGMEGSPSVGLAPRMGAQVRPHQRNFQTSGYTASMKLREIERTKIECARKFFDEISKRVDEDRVKYDVVTDYAKLMDIVSKAA
jgi:hypothetical protein